MFMHRFVGFTPTIPAAQIALETFQTLVDLVTSAQSRTFGSFEAADAAQVALVVVSRVRFTRDDEHQFR